MGKKILTSVCALLLVLLLAACSKNQSTQQTSSAPKDSLGMLLLNLTDEEGMTSFHVSEPGVFVLILDENSLAYTAGLRSGDRIVTYNGTSVSNASDLDSLYEVPGVYALEVYRASTEANLSVTLDNQKIFSEGETSK